MLIAGHSWHFVEFYVLYISHNSFIYTHVWLQEAPVMEYAQVDKSKKKISQEKHKAATKHDNAMAENSVSKVRI